MSIYVKYEPNDPLDALTRPLCVDKMYDEIEGPIEDEFTPLATPGFGDPLDSDVELPAVIEMDYLP